MKKAIYVDYENVNISGLKGIEELTHDDVVKIFIGAQTSKLTMVDANRIFNCEATVELITNKYIGKNALDFIIMVHMGYDLAQGLAKSYYIISKDKGYDPAIHEMRRMSGLTIARKEAIAVIEEKAGLGKRIKGIFGLGKDKESPDTTEHTVVGRGKKDDNAISRIKKEYVHEDEPKKEKKKSKKGYDNKKDYRNDRGVKAGKPTEKTDREKPKYQNVSSKKKTSVKKQEPVRAVSDVKTVELKQSVAAEVNNRAKKPEHIELKHGTASEAINKENQKNDKVEFQTGTALEAINNHSSNNRSYRGRGSGSRNNRGRNNRSNYSGNNNKALSKTSENEYSGESVKNPQIEAVEETESKTVTMPASDYSGFNENRSSKRYNNNRRNNRNNYRKNNNRNSGNSKKSDSSSLESSAIMSAQPIEATNKPVSNHNEPVHVETEYERQRREAFAILEELNSQD